ncbi:MAG: Glutamate--tRNA ligase mitochondrial [Trizodia sp. TS-e1964]|nr:MAG: Glutamate--tRNA ligase mitochondrial [Trizodia sp. TS-e1964]
MSFYLLSSIRTSQWVCRSCLVRFSSTSLKRQPPLHKVRRKLPDGPARTRFAPSPTGYLHLGSLRTALFNYLLAKRTGGQFILRIEDTDQKRTLPDAEERICHDLKWAGLKWDEGPQVGGLRGPYRQSERTSLYVEHATRLLKTGHAYRCFCSSERLKSVADNAKKLGLSANYDRKCASLSAEESLERALKGDQYALRLKAPPNYPPFEDLARGTVGRFVYRNQELLDNGLPVYEDTILLKSDGQPTYHLANVVDDHLMNITHVVRGSEWMTSTPKHLYLYKALNWTPPEFVHVGLLTDLQGQKLSKRKLDLDISTYREELGIIPQALNNYLALLGWSHNTRKDVFTMPQLIEAFDMKFTLGNTIVTPEKLWYLQKHHAVLVAEEGGKQLDLIVNRLLAFVQSHSKAESREFVLRGRELRAYIAAVFRIDAKNYKNANDFLERNFYFFGPIINSFFEPRDRTQLGIPPHQKLVEYSKMLQDIPSGSWTSESIYEKIREIGKALLTEFHSSRGSQSVTSKDTAKIEKNITSIIYGYLRMAIAEGKPGPGLQDVMEILGREVTLERLESAAAINSVKEGSSSQ